MKPEKDNVTTIEYEDGRIVVLDEDDCPELTEEFFKNAKFGLDGLAELIGEEAVAPLRRNGRPPSANPKRNGTLRLDAALWDAIKATGPGYSTRIEAVLRDAVKDGRI